MGPGRPRRIRTEEGEEVSHALYNGVKPGEICSTDIQVAINNGNRREDVFFTARVGKAGSSGPFQQPIPQDFARYYPELNLQDVTLEIASGEKWVVTVRPGANVVRFCKGWRAFSLGNNLRDGNQLIFTQVGKFHFKVTVYDSRGKSRGEPPNVAEASPPNATPTATLYDSRAKALSEHPKVAEASPPEATVSDCRGKALAEPPNVAEPSSSKAMPSQPLTLAAKTDYPLTRPAVLDSNMAKIILRHILPPPPSCQFPDPHITAALTEVPVPIPAPTVDGTRGVTPTEEQNEMVVAEGKDYIFLDSDEDDDLVLLEVAMTTLPKSVPKIAPKTATMVGMYSTGEQSGLRIHSPSEKEEVSTPEIEEPDDSYSVSESDGSDDDDDLPLTRLRRRGSGWMMNRRNYERAAQKKICVRQPSWKGEKMNRAPPQALSSASAPFPITRRKYHELGESSKKPTIQAQEENDDDGEAVCLVCQQGRKNFSDIVCTHRPFLITRSKHHELGESSKKPTIQAQEEDDDDGEAVRLVRQQGRKNFSDIVCTHRRHHIVSGKDKKYALDAAMEFSLELENHKFVAVMYDAQVYHGFHLPVPAEILEATGTQRAKVVEAWLTDKNKKMYMVNWAWHESCETPLLNNDGWAKFALDHFLEEGDVCVFELVNYTSAPTSGFLFHVHIFCVEEAHRDVYWTPLADNFPAYQSGINSAGAEWELRNKEEGKWPLSGEFRMQRRASWTKLIKRSRTHGHFGGSRGQRRF